MPVDWTLDNERKLLIALIDPNMKPSWTEVAAKCGPEFTAEAVRLAANKMPFNWTPEAERQMLFLIIDHMETRPSAEAYQKVASVLGGGLNANAVSQKFYKLKKEAEKLAGSKENGEAASPVATQAKPKAPRKRKGKNDEDGEVATPVKKGRKKPVKKEEEPELKVPAVKEEQHDDTEEGDEDGEQNGGENGHENGDEEVDNEASA